MTLKELLTDELLRLPKRQPEGKNFNSYVIWLLSEYQQKAQKVVFPEGIEAEELLNKLEYLIDGLKEAIRTYYAGNPFNAYRRLRNAIRKSKIYEHWNGYSLTYQKNFYRLRINKGTTPLSRDELFHIPFHKRRLVATQRYSIPGFPSLYLSNSIYTAWEEMRRPPFEEIQAARFVNVLQLTLVDLTTSRYLGKIGEDRNENQLISDFLMWPIIACCSIKVKEPTNYFKPEYIIPQLLLQWIRNHREYAVNGIKFSSTHIDLNEMRSQGDFFNIVIPVCDNREDGFCSSLSKMFKMTDVLSWQIYQYSTGAPGVMHSYTVSESINPDVGRIELIRNKSLPYNFSPLASLELLLNSMKAHDINFS